VFKHDWLSDFHCGTIENGCEKVIGKDKIVSLTGNDFKEGEDFWGTIAKKVGLPLESYGRTIF